MSGEDRPSAYNVANARANALCDMFGDELTKLHGAEQWLTIGSLVTMVLEQHDGSIDEMCDTAIHALAGAVIGRHPPMHYGLVIGLAMERFRAELARIELGKERAAAPQPQ